MEAVILAGGLGTRLRPFTDVIPKPLLPIGEQSLMELQISNLAKHGFDEIYVATNYKSEFVEAFLGDGSKYGVKLTFSKEEQRLGTCGPLGLLRDQLTKPFIMLNGDILTKNNFSQMYEFGMAQEADLTIGTKLVKHPFQYGTVEVGEDGLLTGVTEKPELVFDILAGIYFFKPAVFDDIPSGQYFGMDDLIHGMLSASKPIARWVIKDYWLDIGQAEDYSKAKAEYSMYFEGDSE
ncbi:MAG: sugar phosphate nucleotidyltransferase [Akkermansiaceae bacterium]|jgi:NDP-sugar pyrophosphorylase family protein